MLDLKELALARKRNVENKYLQTFLLEEHRFMVSVSLKNWICVQEIVLRSLSSRCKKGCDLTKTTALTFLPMSTSTTVS